MKKENWQCVGFYVCLDDVIERFKLFRLICILFLCVIMEKLFRVTP